MAHPLQQLNDRLERWREADTLQRKWLRHLRQMERELVDKRREAERWQRKLVEEQADIDKLSGLSLENIFYTVMGSKHDKLREEKKDVVEAKLKLDEAAAAAQEIEQEITGLQRQMNGLGDLQQQYQEIFEQKEQWIHDRHHVLSSELYEIMEEKAKLKAYAKEVEEAIRAGDSVTASLQRALDSLDSAKNWGTWDMLGGGMISTAVKHSRINESQGHVHDAQRKMRSFEKELKDIEQHIQIHFQTDGLIRFADFFFDGLIVDWMMQSRINQSRDQVSGQLGRIRETLRQLNGGLEQCRRQINVLQRRYDELVENA